MDKVTWLVAGNKGGAGKSVVAKSLADWLRTNQVPMTIADGDERTPDVYEAFKEDVPAHQFNLSEEAGWASLSDFLCSKTLAGHIVVNLPDGISSQAIEQIQRLAILANNYDFQVKVLFVLNTLPDGLYLFKNLLATFPDIYPVKNLVFGGKSDFHHFDQLTNRKFGEKTIIFPKMNSQIMTVVRESKLWFSKFLEQKDDTKTNFAYAKIVVADWRDAMHESLADVLEGE